VKHRFTHAATGVIVQENAMIAQGQFATIGEEAGVGSTSALLDPAAVKALVLGGAQIIMVSTEDFAGLRDVLEGK
jgi:hypothetical protein